MNKDKLLTLFMGKCWHEITLPMAQGIQLCKVCGYHRHMFDNNEWHPDFSQPAQWHEFFVWLCGKYENLWGEFYEYAHFNFCIDKSREQYDAWLFSDLSRFTDLFADFLCLPSTIEQWGWEEKFCDHCRKGDRQFHFTHPCEKCGAIGGRIKTSWARYAEEGV